MENKHKPFQGYTLSELRQRMVVNQAKQQQVRAGIDEAVSSVTALKNALFSKPQQQALEARPTGLLGKIDAIITLGNYAVAGYDLFKSVKGVFSKK